MAGRIFGAEGGEKGADALYLYVCACPNVFQFVHVNHESIVSEKFGTEDWLLYVSNDKNPR